MDNQQIQQYRSQLAELRDHLDREINRVRNESLRDVRAVGEHDQHQSESIDKSIGVEHAEEQIREQVHEALQRIDEGEFGKCQDCGQPVAKERLDAIPYTAFCINCEQRREGPEPVQ
ncbi:MAG: TraR/DksA C4-type zinc finger protein [Pirellulales bacterium]